MDEKEIDLSSEEKAIKTFIHAIMHIGDSIHDLADAIRYSADVECGEVENEDDFSRPQTLD